MGCSTPAHLVEFGELAEGVEGARLAPDRLQHLLLAALAGKDAAGLARARVPERRLTIHIVHTRL